MNLGNRNFVALWVAQAVGQAGTRLLQVGVLWWLLSNTIPAKDGLGGTSGSGRTLAIFMVLGALPAIIFATRIGKAIDSYGARRLLTVTPLVGVALAFAMSLLLVTGVDAVLFLYGASFLFATVQAILEPAVMKAVPEIVDRDKTVGAVAALTSSQTLSYFAGALVAAALVESIGLAGCFAVVGICYITAALANIMAFASNASPHGSSKPASERSATTPDGRTAWALVRGMPVIRKVLLGFAIVNFFSIPIMILLPIYTKTILVGSALNLALYEGALWTGLLGGTFLARAVARSRHAFHVTATALLAFGAALLMPGLVVEPFFYGVSLFVVGAALGMVNVRMVSYFQTAVAEHEKGRFFAVMRATTSAAAPLGFFVFGSLADKVPATTLCLVQGIAVLAMSPYFFWLARLELSRTNPLSETTA